MLNKDDRTRAVTFIIPLPSSVKIFDGYRVDFTQLGHNFEDRDAIRSVSNGAKYRIKERLIFRLVPSAIDMRPFEVSGVVMKELRRSTVEQTDIHNRAIVGNATIACITEFIYPKTLKECDYSDLFDRALNTLRSYLKSYYIVDREPIELPSRMNLPIAISVHEEDVLSDGSYIAGDSNIKQSLFMLNTEIDPFVYSGDSLEIDKLASALHLDAMCGSSVINPTLDTYREASLAYRRGEMISASILFASSIEIFLDTLLMYLLWEDGKRPAEAYEIMYETKMCSCDECKVKVSTTLDRVLNGLYASRIGGDWSKNSQLMKLWREVAELRNKAVHSGIEPEVKSVTRLMEIVPRIQKILTDYLVSAIKSYPLTAYFFAGQDGLQRRGLSSNLNDYIPIDTPKPVSLSLFFVNWKLEVEKLNSKKLRKTTDNKCKLAFVIHLSGRREWIIYDRTLRIFRIINKQNISAEAQNQIDSLIKKTIDKPLSESIILDFPNITPKIKTSKTTWHPMYLLSQSMYCIDRWPTYYIMPKE